jgi:UDP-2,3-diacylglucosamine hydrolase
LHRRPIVREFFGKKIFIGHGDGLGPGDKGYKFLKKVFDNKFCQWCFARLHPNFGLGLANYSSKTSRAKTGDHDEVFNGKENEWLYLFCNEYLKKEHIDLFVFGHRHLPLNIELDNNSRYINLGDWLRYFTYLEFDGSDYSELKVWE